MPHMISSYLFLSSYYFLVFYQKKSYYFLVGATDIMELYYAYTRRQSRSLPFKNERRPSIVDYLLCKNGTTFQRKKNTVHCTWILLLFSKEKEDERKCGNNKDDNTIDIHMLLSCTIAVFCPCYQLIIATRILPSEHTSTLFGSNS